MKTLYESITNVAEGILDIDDNMNKYSSNSEMMRIQRILNYSPSRDTNVIPWPIWPHTEEEYESCVKNNMSVWRNHSQSEKYTLNNFEYLIELDKMFSELNMVRPRRRIKIKQVREDGRFLTCSNNYHKYEGHVIVFNPLNISNGTPNKDIFLICDRGRGQWLVPVEFVVGEKIKKEFEYSLTRYSKEMVGIPVHYEKNLDGIEKYIKKQYNM